MSCCVFTLLALPALLPSVVSVTYVFWFFLGFCVMNSLTLGYWFRPLIFWSVSTRPYEFHLPKMCCYYFFSLSCSCSFVPLFSLYYHYSEFSGRIRRKYIQPTMFSWNPSIWLSIINNIVKQCQLEDFAKSSSLAKRGPVKCQSFPQDSINFWTAHVLKAILDLCLESLVNCINLSSSFRSGTFSSTVSLFLLLFLHLFYSFGNSDSL